MAEHLPAAHVLTIAARGDDVSPLLPQPARDRLQQLRQERDDRHAVLRGMADDYEAARMAVKQARGRRDQLNVPRLPTFDAAPQNLPAGLRQAEVLLVQAKAELDRVEKVRDAREEAWSVACRLVENCEAFVRDAQGTIRAVTAEPPTLRKNETALVALKRVRAQLEVLAAERIRTSNAPLPIAVVKAGIVEQVNALAERGRPSIQGTAIRWPSLPIGALPPRYAGSSRTAEMGSAELFDALAFEVWLSRDAVLKRLLVEAETGAPDQTTTLTEAQRLAHLADLDAQGLELERQEDALVMLAIEQGYVAERRPDADPRAVLGITLTQAEQQEAA